jgi:hypothetical protein
VKHRNHIIPCVIVAAIAVVFLATGGSTPLGAGVGFLLLLCPLLMGAVMWLLMRRPDASTARGEHQHSDLLDERQTVSRAPH